MDLARRSQQHEKGLASPHFPRINNVTWHIAEETAAIMALILDRKVEITGLPVKDIQIQAFARTVAHAGMLMPGGTMQSRQNLVTLAIMAGL